MSERQYWVGFSLVKGVGSVRVRQLLERFGSLRAAWEAPTDALAEAGLDRRALRNLNEARRRVDLDAELARLDKLGIAVLTWDDPDYPALLGELRAIDHAPPVIYLRGSLTETDDWALAVVGRRSVSAYGRQVTHQLAADLAAAGLTIVSGLARGVDAGAHQAALEVGARTLAVLACGLDIIYPPEHAGLAAEVMHNGAVMSPFPLGTKPLAGNFAARNQMLAGLARGALVCEAGEKSGALITAGYALEQGREVFAVPGNITARGSTGANRLIQDGAHPVMTARDVLEVLDLGNLPQFIEARQSLPAMTPTEQVIVDCLGAEAAHIDELTQRSGLPVAAVSSALVTLELKGVVRQVAPMTYVKASLRGA